MYHVTLVFIFQVKSWPDSTYCCFVNWKLVSTLLQNNPAFYLVIIQSFLNFLLILWIPNGKQCKANSWNQQKFFSPQDLSFNFLEILKALLNCVYLTCDFKYLTLRCNVRRYSQSLPAKMATLGLLKIKVFWNKDYDVMIYVHDVTTKILLVIQIILKMQPCDQSLVTLAFVAETLQ